MAKSRWASSSKVTFSCEGIWCVEPSEAEQASPDAPTPDEEPTPDPTPTPVDPEDGGDSHDEMFWIWIIIALGVLILIALFFAIYFCMKSKKQQKWAAIQYANTPENDGDLIEKDVEKDAYAGQGKPTIDRSLEILEDEAVPSAYALQ